MKEPTESKRTGDRSPDLATWKSTTLAASVAKVLPRKSTFTTLSGLPIEALYTEAHVGVSEPTKGLGFPGEYPFTRGVHPTTYRARPWTIRQVAGFGTAEDTNGRYKYLLAHGETGLSTDLPPARIPCNWPCRIQIRSTIKRRGNASSGRGGRTGSPTPAAAWPD